ncbi:glycosyltransferase family 1 protein [Anaerolineales bacterium]
MSTITIDYTAAYEQGGGIGRYVRELVNALAKTPQYHYKLFVSGTNGRDLPDLSNSAFEWKSTLISSVWLARFWHRLHLPLPIEYFCGNTDLFHATDFVLPPTKSTTKTILTVHDLSFVRVPETASPALKSYLDYVVPRSIKAANHILADSQATKEDLMEIYKTPEEKISVLLSGIDESFEPITDIRTIQSIKEQYLIPNKPYLFTVGTVQPRKNYSRVIHALANLRKQGHDLILVIAGGKGWLEDEMHYTIHETHMDDYVFLIGYADDEDLSALYSGSECVVFPSLYEGFGFPVLEAMACGKPVITSNISSLPEVAGDAAIMIDPYDVNALTKAIIDIIENTSLREDMIQRGFQHLQNFSWSKSADQLQNLYTRILETN